MKPNRWTMLLQNHVVAMVLALVLVVPVLFAGPSTQRVDQLTAYGILGLILLVGWAFRAQDRVSLAKLRTFLGSGPNLPIVLYAVWSVVCAAVSPHPLYAQVALVQLLFGLAIYGGVVYQFRHRSQVKALLSCIVVVGGLSVLAGLAVQRESLMDLAGTFQDRQLFAAFLGLILPVLVGVAAGTKDRFWKMTSQVAALLVAGALLLTRCRSSWLGAAVAIIAFVVLSMVFVWKWSAVARKKHELLITPALAVVVLGVFVAFTRMGGPLQFRANTVNAIMKDASVVDRLGLWGTATKVIESSPVLGVGPGAYAVAQQPFNPNSRSLASIRRTGPSLSENPHNYYLQTAAETGLPGLALYLAILAMFFVYGVRALPRMDKGLRQYTLVGALAAVAGHSVDAMANPAWGYPQVSTFFWLILGVGMCAAGLGQEVVEEKKAAVASGETIFGMPVFLYRGLRTALVGCGAVAVAAQILSLNRLSVAAAGGQGIVVAQTHVYGHDDTPDDGGDSGTAATAAIAIGGAAAVAAGVGALAAGGAAVAATAVGAAAGTAAGIAAAGGGASGFLAGTVVDCKDRFAALPAGHRVKDIRILPFQATVDSGRCLCFFLEVKSANDNKWYSVTKDQATRFEVADEHLNNGCLLRQEGQKNIFCVPTNAPLTCNGRTFVVVGTFAPAGQAPRYAESRVLVRVPGPDGSVTVPAGPREDEG